MGAGPDKRRPPRRRLLSVTDIADVCGVSRDVAKMWDWNGLLPEPEAGTGGSRPTRGWEADDVFTEWCELRGMSRAEFDQALAALWGDTRPS